MIDVIRETKKKQFGLIKNRFWYMFVLFYFPIQKCF